ncbi:MAG: peptidylprolyl isomerase [Bryobacterales bacterium]|nr:peptidylprolyl isomerase [Bryobacterales bacterium]
MRSFLPMALVATAVAQSPGPLPPETVVATVDGKPVTVAELQGLYRTVGPQVQQNAARDPAAFLRQYAMLKRLSEYAEKHKLDQQSPYREAIAAGRMQVLYQAAIQHTYENIPVLPEDQKKFYEAHRDRWIQARVKVIYIPFSENPAAASGGKKPMSEKEARAKAEAIVKQLRAGADFVKMVREHSEDPTSAAKDGDFPLISKSDQIPDAIKQAVFALNKGDISDPVRAPNGFYIFRAEEITSKPYDAVKDEIFNEIKLARLKEFLDSVQKGVEIKIENETFFRQAPASEGNLPAPR